MKLFKKAKRGFTLVELVVVIAVIAILAAVSVGAYFGITESANSSRLEQEAKAAHTNIQLVAMNQDDNSNLTREGLYINDLDTFETKMESYSGFHYDIVAQEPSAVNNPTLYFCNETGVSSANIVNQRFNTFKYYNPEVGNKRASVNIPSGDIIIEEATFEFGDPEPIVITSIEFDGISDTVDNFFVGDRKTFDVVTEPAGLGYTFEIGNENVIKIEGNEIVAVGPGISEVIVKSKNLDLNGDQLTDVITVNVTAVEIVELIVNGFETTYKENVEFDLSDVTYQLKFNNSDTVLIDVPSSDVTVSATKAALDMTSVTFTYSGTHGTKDKTVDILVEPRELDSISCNVSLIEKQYIATDVIDLTGFEFKAHYDNGEVENINHQDLEYTSELTAGQGSITFKYPKTGENQKSITIGFDKSVVGIQITHIEVIGEVKTIWNIGDDVKKDGLTFKAIKNKGEPIDITSEVVADPAKITAETERIRYSYFDSNSNKTFYTEYVNIEKTDYRTFYFEDKPWWSSDNAATNVQLYDENNNVMFMNGSFGQRMKTVEDSSLAITGGTTIWCIENVDVLKWKEIKFLRTNPEDYKVSWHAQTVSYSIDDLVENNHNILYLNKEAKWYNDGINSEAGISDTGVFAGPVNLDVYIRHLDGSELLNPEYKMTFEDGVFTKTVDLAYESEFDIFVDYHETIWGYDNLTDKGLFTNVSEKKIKTSLAAEGTYKVSIDPYSGEIVLSLVNYFENDLVLAGSFNGEAWSHNVKSGYRNANVYSFSDIELKYNDRFKFRIGENDAYTHEWSYDNLDDDAKQIFTRDDDNNIVFKNKNIGSCKVNFVVDIFAHTITAEFLSKGNKMLFLNPWQWTSDNAWMAAYFFGNGSAWKKMNDVDSDGIYEVEIETGYPNVIFCRMNSGNTSEYSFDNAWNQTYDLTITDKDLYRITAWGSNGDKKCSGEWSIY